MDKYKERQTELLCFLNDNNIQNSPEFEQIADIFDIEYVNETGWCLTDE